MSDLAEILKYLDFFGAKITFYLDQKTKLYTITGGILTLLSFFFCLFIFILQSINDFKRAQPITSVSTLTYKKSNRRIKFGDEKIWIPWRIVDYNKNYFNHTNILFPIINYYYGKKRNNSLDIKKKSLNYMLCNETSMINNSDKFLINTPLNEIYCIDMDDLYMGESLVSGFISYVKFDLYFCKNGLDYNENDKSCTTYDNYKKTVGENNSLEFDIYFPEVQFNPMNLKNPIEVIYNKRFFYLSKFSNKIDKIYLQEHVLLDDIELFTTRYKNNSYWGIDKVDRETYFISNAKDLFNGGSTSRIYSFNIYIENKIVYYKRCYKKIQAIISENFPLLYFIYIIFKGISNILKKAKINEKMMEILFEKISEKTKQAKKNIKIKKRKRNSIGIEGIKFRGLCSNLNINNNIIKGSSCKGNELYKFLSNANILQHVDKQSKNDKSKLNLINNNESINNNIINMGLSLKQLNSPNNSNKKIVKNRIKLFPWRYYLFSVFIKTIDVEKYYKCCFSKKFINVYKFIGELLDISSYLKLQREFNILKNSSLRKGLEVIEFGKKINVNDKNFTKNMSECVSQDKLNIFTKNVERSKIN